MQSINLSEILLNLFALIFLSATVFVNPRPSIFRSVAISEVCNMATLARSFRFDPRGAFDLVHALTGLAPQWSALV